MTKFNLVSPTIVFSTTEWIRYKCVPMNSDSDEQVVLVHAYSSRTSYIELQWKIYTQNNTKTTQQNQVQLSSIIGPLIHNPSKCLLNRSVTTTKRFLWCLWLIFFNNK